MIHLLASDYSIILLIKGGNLSGTSSYQALVQSTFGFPGFLVLSALQFLYPFIGVSFIFHRAHARRYDSACVTICSGAFMSIKLEMNNRFLHFPSPAMISYNITTGDTLTKVFQRIPGGAVWNMLFASDPEILDAHVKKRSNPPAAVGPGHILAERHFVILLSTVVFTLPLSLYRNIEKLGKVSLHTSLLHLL